MKTTIGEKLPACDELCVIDVKSIINRIEMHISVLTCVQLFTLEQREGMSYFARTSIREIDERSMEDNSRKKMMDYRER